MTKEQAIEFGNRVIDLGFHDDTHDFTVLAVEALEDDLEVINDIDKHIEYMTGEDTYAIGFRNGLRFTKSLLTREVPRLEAIPFINEIRRS